MVGARDAAFHEARAQLIATGASDDGRIRIAVRGMRHWTVQVASGTTLVLTEEAFVAGVRTAAARLIQHQADQMALLKARTYASGLLQSHVDPGHGRFSGGHGGE